ncbi:MAG TPA: sensor histidine kinase [Bryobacteraceae bacterium]|nr:sensor histidine kinase [Bryobacteraceae bacterium]
MFVENSSRQPPYQGQPHGQSHRQTRVALFAGFGGLLLLLAVLGLSAVSFLSQIRSREENIRQDYVERDRVLENLRSEIYISGTYARDFLLDTSEDAAAGHRKQYLETERRLRRQFADYRRMMSGAEAAPVNSLAGELDTYLRTLAPVLNWNAAERRSRAYSFMQEQLLPLRASALELADRLEQINVRQLEQNSSSVSTLLSSFRVKLFILLVLTVVGGSALAAVSLLRLLRLERESERRFAEVLSTREELQRLSAELVSAQEGERRRISRELHDEVGQLLSAAVFGLGNVRSALKSGDTAEALQQLQAVEEMTQRNASVVRNISLLLRPTMLDDLGLIPALKWLARETSRTGQMAVDIAADPFVDDLPEEHRTCIFRIVQEAIRNAARHSGASQVRVYLKEKAGRIWLSIQDDGKGFNPREERGLGILGIQERVGRLGGSLDVNSRPGGGTIVRFDLPLPAEHKSSEDAIASAPQ